MHSDLIYFLPLSIFNNMLCLVKRCFKTSLLKSLMRPIDFHAIHVSMNVFYFLFNFFAGNVIRSVVRPVSCLDSLFLVCLAYAALCCCCIRHTWHNNGVRSDWSPVFSHVLILNKQF